MKKKLNKIGHIAEVIFDGTWKVQIKFKDMLMYFYIFENEEDAINRFNNLK